MSASDALRAAVAIQIAVETQEAEIAPERRMRYRMGIDLGDVIPSGDDLTGDGINVTVRLEAISTPGGIRFRPHWLHKRHCTKHLLASRWINQNLTFCDLLLCLSLTAHLS